MRSLKYKLDRLSLERIYIRFIRPLLEYGDIVWDLPGESLKPLETIQLNAARIVTGATAKSRSEGLYRETGWEPLHSRREFHRLSLYYKIVNGKAPPYLTDLVPNLVQDRTNYMLRNRGNFDNLVARLNIYANSFFPKTTKLWNNLDLRTKNLPSIEAFKSHHKRSLPKKNSLYYYGGRLESAIHTRMRLGNSPLNRHLNKMLHVIDSPLCGCGIGKEETPKHFFFECSRYRDLREVLRQDLLPYDIRKIDHLLYGLPGVDHLTNIHIFCAVHKYIRDSKRFY
jgi:hypothetical protein